MIPHAPSPAILKDLFQAGLKVTRVLFNNLRVKWRKGDAVAKRSLKKQRSGNRKSAVQYHSVEFSINELDLPYQFRVWETASGSIRVLVRGDSGVLPFLKVGDTLAMKYYSTDSIYPLENIRTAIRQITKKNRGRLKGHYLLGLEILEAWVLNNHDPILPLTHL